MMQNDTDEIIDIEILNQNEIELIRSLRTRFRFGEVTILMKDGVPVRWKKITEFDEPKPITVFRKDT